MLRHHPEGVVGVRVAVVLPPAQASGALHQRGEQVRLVYAVCLLKDDGGPLQPHAGVYVGRRQRRARALRVLVVLHEDQVPKLDKAVAREAGVGDYVLAVGAAVGLLAAAL